MKYRFPVPAARHWAIWLLLLAVGGAAAAQTPAKTPAQNSPAPKPQQARPPISIVKNVNSVPITFAAVDKHNHFVAGLQATDIQVFDNGRQQAIQHFDPQAELPLHIAMLLDVSSSIRTRWDFEQRAALDFLQSVLVPGRDEAAVVAFDTGIHLVTDFTDNYEKLAAGIHGLRPGGGTALYDALYYSAHDKLGPASAGEVRNVVVIITDGLDDQSRYSRDEAMEQAQDIGAVIYTIGTEPTGSDPESDKVLRRFADQTGGLSFFPFEARDLGTAFQGILLDLRHQYVIAYAPDNFIPNGQFHKVEIRILKKGLTARLRSGYFALPAPTN